MLTGKHVFVATLNSFCHRKVVWSVVCSSCLVLLLAAGSEAFAAAAWCCFWLLLADLNLLHCMCFTASVSMHAFCTSVLTDLAAVSWKWHSSGCLWLYLAKFLVHGFCIGFGEVSDMF